MLIVVNRFDPIRGFPDRHCARWNHQAWSLLPSRRCRHCGHRRQASTDAWVFFNPFRPLLDLWEIGGFVDEKQKIVGGCVKPLILKPSNPAITFVLQRAFCCLRARPCAVGSYAVNIITNSRADALIALLRSKQLSIEAFFPFLVHLIDRQVSVDERYLVAMCHLEMSIDNRSRFFPELRVPRVSGIAFKEMPLVDVFLADKQHGASSRQIRQFEIKHLQLHRDLLDLLSSLGNYDLAMVSPRLCVAWDIDINPD